MSIDHGSEGTNTARDRVWIPLVLPVAAAVITGVLIVAIGSTLLAFNTVLFDIGEEHLVTPLFIALGMTLAVLFGAAIVAKVWAADDE